MNRLDAVKNKLNKEWLENTANRTQCLQKYIGKEFTDQVKHELQKYCNPYIDVQTYDNEKDFLIERELSAKHVLDKLDNWIICLVLHNIILDIDFAQG